jgi:hypothetical protein
MMDFYDAVSYWNCYKTICETLDRVIPQNDWAIWWDETEKAKVAFESETGWNLSEFAKSYAAIYG